MHEFPNLDLACDANGHPAGLVIVFGYPQVWATAAIQWATPLGAVASFQLASGVTLLIALAGARRLFGRYTTSAWLAWSAAAIFLLSPIVSDQAGYGPMQLGFALVPCYLLVDVWFMRCLDRRRHVALGFAAVVAMRTYALFTDGYSFVMSLFLIGLAYLFWGVGHLRLPGPRRPVIVGWLEAGASVLIVYTLYARYLGVSAFDSMPVDFFRGQGVDLFALVTPSSVIWLAAKLGIHHTLEATEAYSDGPNITSVFLGYALVGGAIGGAVVAWRRRLFDAVLAAITVSGVIGFVLALGPSLKVADFRTPQALHDGVPSGDVYLMRADEATAPTGLAWIYRHVPGIDTMRALYRWELLVKLALIALLVVAVGELVRRRHQLWAIVLVVAVALESLPSPARAERIGTTAWRRSPSSPPTWSTRCATRCDPTSGRSSSIASPAALGNNAYLANWICPILELRCYNAGGDKGVALASRDQPPAAVAAMSSSAMFADNLRQLFATDAIDVAILTDFDLRASAYAWPPTAATRDEARDAADAARRERRVRGGPTWSGRPCCDR